MIVKKASVIFKSYLEDLEECFAEEFVKFIKLLKTNLANHIGTKQNHDSCSMFTNWSGGKHSFSKLKIIKNELTNNTRQKKVNNLTLISIKNEYVHEIDISSINKFAQIVLLLFVTVEIYTYMYVILIKYHICLSYLSV